MTIKMKKPSKSFILGQRLSAFNIELTQQIVWKKFPTLKYAPSKYIPPKIIGKRFWILTKSEGSDFTNNENNLLKWYHNCQNLIEVEYRLLQLEGKIKTMNEYWDHPDRIVKSKLKVPKLKTKEKLLAAIFDKAKEVSDPIILDLPPILFHKQKQDDLHKSIHKMVNDLMLKHEPIIKHFDSKENKK
jgi:hypothetical protein